MSKNLCNKPISGVILKKKQKGFEITIDENVYDGLCIFIIIQSYVHCDKYVIEDIREVMGGIDGGAVVTRSWYRQSRYGLMEFLTYWNGRKTPAGIDSHYASESKRNSFSLRIDIAFEADGDFCKNIENCWPISPLLRDDTIQFAYGSGATMFDSLKNSLKK